MDNKTKEEIYPASKLNNVDELMVTLEEPSKDEKVNEATVIPIVGENQESTKVDDLSKNEEDEAMDSSEGGEEKQGSSTPKDDIKTLYGTNG